MGRKPLNRPAEEKQRRKNETRRRHQQELRRAIAISDYLLLAATEQHRQATAFINKLEEKYPGKIDVRKTPEFREWQTKQLSIISNQALPSGATGQSQADTNLNETPVVPSSEEDPGNNIFDEIPDNIINDIITEIRNDPELNTIINDFNLAESIHDELDIEIDDRLEDELNNLI